jgi:GTPase
MTSQDTTLDNADSAVTDMDAEAEHVEEAALAQHPIVRIVACGSVDDGKSTLIGRLLA